MVVSSVPESEITPTHSLARKREVGGPVWARLSSTDCRLTGVTSELRQRSLNLTCLDWPSKIDYGLCFTFRGH